jgi:hypothetical protein
MSECWLREAFGEKVSELIPSVDFARRNSEARVIACITSIGVPSRWPTNPFTTKCQNSTYLLEIESRKGVLDWALSFLIIFI